MAKLNRREIGGLKLFSCFAGVIIIIGVLMNILGEQISGRAGPRMGPSRHVVLSGNSVIWVGVIMLVIAFVVYLDGKKNNSKDE